MLYNNIFLHIFLIKFIKDTDDLMVLVDDIVPFQMQHNAEAEAVDLLLEVQQLSKLLTSNVVDERNYERVCLYLLRSSDLMADPDDLQELLWLI